LTRRQHRVQSDGTSIVVGDLSFKGSLYAANHPQRPSDAVPHFGVDRPGCLKKSLQHDCDRIHHRHQILVETTMCRRKHGAGVVQSNRAPHGRINAPGPPRVSGARVPAPSGPPLANARGTVGRREAQVIDCCKHRGGEGREISDPPKWRAPACSNLAETNLFGEIGFARNFSREYGAPQKRGLQCRETRLNRHFPSSHRRRPKLLPLAHSANTDSNSGGKFKVNSRFRIAPGSSFSCKPAAQLTGPRALPRSSPARAKLSVLGQALSNPIRPCETN
jgi:hypothetical protein